MKRIILVPLLTFTISIAPGLVWGKQLFVVVNRKNNISHLTRKEVTDMYMGRIQYFSDGRVALKIDSPGHSELRLAFYKNLVGMTLPAVNAYWARLVFDGRASPPVQVANEHDVIELVKSNPNAIGYVPEVDKTKDVKIVFSIQVD